MSQGIDILHQFPELAAIGRLQLQAYCDEWLQRPIAREYGVDVISVGYDLSPNINLDPERATRVGERVSLPVDQLLGYIVDRHIADPADRRRLYRSFRDSHEQWAALPLEHGLTVARRGRLYLTCKSCGAELETGHEGVEGWSIALPRRIRRLLPLASDVRNWCRKTVTRGF